MTQPFLIIGCGGSGGKVVLGLRNRLEAELRSKGWTKGIPTAWQLKWIDVPEIQELHLNFGQPLPLGDYLSLATVNDYRIYDTSLTSGANATKISRLAGWRPSPSNPTPVEKGAGQMRAVGRVVALSRIQEIKRLVRESLEDCARGGVELSQLMDHLGQRVTGKSPVVIVVSSMAGGTGAGIFMDVCDITRGIDPNLGKQIFGVLFTPEIFPKDADSGAMVPNTVASLSELMNGYLTSDRNPEELYGPVGGVGVSGKSGPSIPFVIGMQPLDGGAPLESTSQCYRAVTETLRASMMNADFAQSFLNYQVTNFVPNAGPNKRLTSYQFLNQPRVVNEVPPCGVVSSFGSSQVSVGTSLFGSWARDRLSRSVIDHLTVSWRDFGREQMASAAGPTTTDEHVIRFLVDKYRESFISDCGLLEEDDLDGSTKHDQVQDGILSAAVKTTHVNQLKENIRQEISKIQKQNRKEWISKIKNAGSINDDRYLREASKLISSGFENYGAEVGGKVEEAVSRYVAKYGVPVTRALVQELKNQCEVARRQLAGDLEDANKKSRLDIGAQLLKVFDAIKDDKTQIPSNNKAVSDAIDKYGIIKKWSLQSLLIERSIIFLDRVISRLVFPLESALQELSATLDSPTVKETVAGWPDDSGEVGDAYRPAPTDKVLLKHETWNSHYERILTESKGSVEKARDFVAAGGFEFGTLNPERSMSMLTFDRAVRWWDDSPAKIKLHLSPSEVSLRVSQWLLSDDDPAGKFIKMGLREYLGEGDGRGLRRLPDFEEALSAAVNLAQPLMRVPRNMMQHVHNGKQDLPCSFICEQFPFPDAMKEARSIVERVMHGKPEPDGGWFTGDNSKSVEQVLMTSVLENAVQPAVVMSLTEPIYELWSQLKSQAEGLQGAAIQGFWTNNRSRLLTESIPLTSVSMRTIIKGWFTGRLLGLITDPDENVPFKVLYNSQGQTNTAELPWPLLHHGRVHDLHRTRSHTTKYLPALLEHLGLAMMILGHERQSLDGYEQLFLMGNGSSEIISQWILEGSLPVSSPQAPQVSGSSARERQQNLERSLDTLINKYAEEVSRQHWPVEWSQFCEIPFGIELFPMFGECLAELKTHTRVDLDPVLG